MPLHLEDPTLLNDYAEFFSQCVEEHVETSKITEYDKLRQFEENPVGITEFIVSDKYLNMANYIYPAGIWVAEMFYNPQDHYNDLIITSPSPRFAGDYTFPGFNQLGYSKEQVADLNFKELVLFIGQRSLKSVLSAVITLYETYKILVMPNLYEYYGIMPGTELTFSVGATSAEQAKGTVFGYIENFRDISPWFQKYINAARPIKVYGKSIYHEIENEFQFLNKILTVDVVAAKSGTMRGYTRPGFVIDEIAHFDIEAKQRSGKAIYDALTASTETFKDKSVRINISSPAYPLDMICQLYAKCGTKFSSNFYEERGYQHLTELDNQPIVLDQAAIGFHYPTWEINPELSWKYLQPQIDADPDSKLRDFGALPSLAKNPYIPDIYAIDLVFNHPEIFNPITVSNQILPEWQVKHSEAISPIYIHVDKGAGRPSNFGFAAGYAFIHKDDLIEQNVIKVKIIVAHAVQADPRLGEVDFKATHELLDVVIKRLGRPYYSSDGWNDIEYRQHLLRDSLCARVENMPVKDEHYDAMKQLILTRRLNSVNNPLACQEIKRLELHVGKKVQKGIGFTKDIADCMAVVSARAIENIARRTTGIGKATLGVWGFNQ